MANKKTALRQTSAEVFYKEPRAATGPQGPITVQFGTNASNLEMAKCYPVGYNSTTGLYAPWMAPDPTVLTVDTGGATGGTWGLTVNGIVIANTTLAYNATAALVAATIKASTGVVASVELAAGVYTITFDAEPEIISVPSTAGDVTQLTGGSGEAATEAAGTSSFGTHKFQGFVFPNTVTLDDTDTVQGAVAVDGQIHIEEMTDLVDSGDVAALTAEVKKRGLIAIKVYGVANIHKEVE
jgi:hypothetical protein